ncbi:MAG: hypothetical protein U0822_27900 [Anaerolineae bacterium]
MRIVIVILAVADGVLHFLLDFILFGGRVFGNPFPGPPPGAPPGGPAGPPPNPLILPLNELFLLNMIGWLVLAVLFWFSPRLLGARRWIINVLMILYGLATIGGWMMFNRPNPRGLGYVDKGLEVVLIILLIWHIWIIFREQRALPQEAAAA